MTNGEFLEGKIEKIWNSKISSIVSLILFIISVTLLSVFRFIFLIPFVIVFGIITSLKICYFIDNWLNSEYKGNKKYENYSKRKNGRNSKKDTSFDD